MSKAEKGNWDEDFKEDAGGEKPSNQDRPKTLYMDMSKPAKYTVRLVGPHVKCRKHFKPYRAVVQDNEKNVDPAWQAGFFPQKRYAVNVIDRSDGKLKILEKGASVFKHFANYKAVFGKDPAGVKDGPDFLITVTVPKGPNGQLNKLKTDYTVTHLKEAPLTKEEIEMIKAQKLWPLTDIYKSTPPEKMKEMWDALPDDKKIPPKREGDNSDSGDTRPAQSAQPANIPVVQAKVEPVEEKMEGAPADSEDLFEENDAEGKDDKDSTNLF